jgi:ActR/RegA family two-component response regulator
VSELVAILHIEDDPLVTRALGRAFAARGRRLTAVESCAEARSQRRSFAAAIFDIDLPDGDGVALAAELLESGSVGRAVFYTGTKDADVLRRARALGRVVAKGEPLEALLLALNAAGDDARGPASGVEVAPSPKREAG